MSEFPTQKLDPKIKYSATNFKIIADFGAASTHGGHRCVECKNCQRYSECHHPRLAKPFKLGTHADRLGCRNGWEAHAETRRRGKSGGSGKSGNEANARRGQNLKVNLRDCRTGKIVATIYGGERMAARIVEAVNGRETMGDCLSGKQ